MVDSVVNDGETNSVTRNSSVDVAGSTSDVTASVNHQHATECQPSSERPGTNGLPVIVDSENANGAGIGAHGDGVVTPCGGRMPEADVPVHGKAEAGRHGQGNGNDHNSTDQPTAIADDRPHVVNTGDVCGDGDKISASASLSFTVTPCSSVAFDDTTIDVPSGSTAISANPALQRTGPDSESQDITLKTLSNSFSTQDKAVAAEQASDASAGSHTVSALNLLPLSTKSVNLHPLRRYSAPEVTGNSQNVYSNKAVWQKEFREPAVWSDSNRRSLPASESVYAGVDIDKQLPTGIDTYRSDNISNADYRISSAGSRASGSNQKSSMKFDVLESSTSSGDWSNGGSNVKRVPANTVDSSSSFHSAAVRAAADSDSNVFASPRSVPSDDQRRVDDSDSIATSESVVGSDVLRDRSRNGRKSDQTVGAGRANGTDDFATLQRVSRTFHIFCHVRVPGL